MATSCGLMPIGSAVWHEQHKQNDNDAGTANGICEFFDNSFADDDRANASRVDLKLSVLVPDSGVKVAVLCDNGGGARRIQDLAMLYKSRQGLAQAEQRSISGLWSFGAKWAVWVTAKQTAVLYNRRRGAAAANGEAPLHQELLLLSNCASPDTISTATLDLTGIPQSEEDIKQWLAERKVTAIQQRGQEGQHWMDAMQAFGQLPGFKTALSDEVMGVYNLYTFVRDQFLSCRGRSQAGTGALWLLPDPSNTLQAWGEKMNHEVADLLMSRYAFGLSKLLPQDLEVRPGRLYRDVALTPTFVIHAASERGSAVLKPADLELRGINKRLRSYRSAVVPLHLPLPPAAAAAAAAAQLGEGGPGVGGAAVVAQPGGDPRRPFAYMWLTTGPLESVGWRKLHLQGVPQVTAVHYMRSMEASHLLHTSGLPTTSEADSSAASTFHARLGNTMEWKGVFAPSGPLAQLGLRPGSIVDIGDGQSIPLTADALGQRWRLDAREPEGVKPLLLGAGIQVVLFLPPGNGVLRPNKTKTKGKLVPGQSPWAIEKLIRLQQVKLVLMYPPPQVIEKYIVLLHHQAAEAEQIRGAVQQQMQGAGSSASAVTASLATAQQQAEVVMECKQQLKQEREKAAQDFSHTPITLGWLVKLEQRSSAALQQAQVSLAAAGSSQTPPQTPVAPPGEGGSNNSSSSGGGLGPGRQAASSRSNKPRTPKVVPRKRAQPATNSTASPAPAAASSSEKRPRRAVKVNRRFDPADLVLTREEEEAAIAAGEWDPPPKPKRGRGGAATPPAAAAAGAATAAAARGTSAAGGRGTTTGVGAARRTQQLPLQQPTPLQQPAQQPQLVQQPQLLAQTVQQLQGVEGVLSQLATAAGEPAAADAVELLAAVRAFTGKWSA